MNKRTKIIGLAVLIAIVLAIIACELLMPVGDRVTPQECAWYGYRLGFIEGHDRGYAQAELDYAIAPDPNRPS